MDRGPSLNGPVSQHQQLPYKFFNYSAAAIARLSWSTLPSGGLGFPYIAMQESPLEDTICYARETPSVTRTPITSHLVRRAPLRGKSGSPKCLAWRPDADRLLCGLASGEVAAYSATSFDCEDLKRILAAVGEITTICPLRGSEKIIAGDGSGKLHFATSNFAPLEIVPLYNQHERVFDICLNPTETLAAIGVKSTHPVLLDLETRQLLTVFTSLGFGIVTMDWHPRRTLIAAGSRGHEVQVWDSRLALLAKEGTTAHEESHQSGNIVAEGFAHKSSVSKVQWHPTNDFLMLSVGRDQLLYVWDLRRPRLFGNDRAWIPSQTSKLTDQDNAKSTSAPPELPLSYWSGVVASEIANDVKDPASTSFCPWCMSAMSSNRHRKLDNEFARRYPTAAAWHPNDPTLFVVGDSSGCMSFWKEGSQACCVDNAFSKSAYSWSPNSGIESLIWHPAGTLLVAASGPSVGLNGTVSFWRVPPRWTTLCTSSWCGHACHFDRGV